MENKKWYVGQKVYDKIVSEEAGEIKSIIHNTENPIRVDFKISEFSTLTEYYTLDGIKVHRNFPSLSTKPYEIIMEGFSQEVEEELPYKGQVCWGIDSLGIWYVGHFVEKDEQGLYWVSNSNNHTPPFSFAEITTKNPYAVEEEVSKMETTDREPEIGDMCFFWDNLDKNVLAFGRLENINKEANAPFRLNYIDGALFGFKHCSLKNPLIK